MIGFTPPLPTTLPLARQPASHQACPAAGPWPLLDQSFPGSLNGGSPRFREVFSQAAFILSRELCIWSPCLSAPQHLPLSGLNHFSAFLSLPPPEQTVRGWACSTPYPQHVAQHLHRTGNDEILLNESVKVCTERCICLSLGSSPEQTKSCSPLHT